jgi:AmiR/NasT family two-component response regulator
VIHPIAQAMADVSTVAILQGQAGKEREMLNEQLQTALDSRIVIEQGKGVLATRLGVEIDEAFELMRRHARNARRPLAEVAEEVVHARSEEFWQAFRRR